MSEYNNEKYPVCGLKPKSETNVLNFLQKYPEFNGKDTVIAILDSGVDPLASGLQKLPNGETKVIERFDCSGSGDVQTTTIVTANNDDTIIGLSGRTLKLSEFMKTQNVNSEYRLGLKSLFDLYPSRIREKIANDAKQKKWDENNKKVLADISRDAADFDGKNPNANNLSFRDKLIKENLDGYNEFVTNIDKKFSETKITYDCILFKSKLNHWIAVIDINENGDLEHAAVIREYSKFHDMVKVDEYLSVSINVHDDGNTLEIVAMCSSHGTHVASIAAGYHPENEELNGVSPASKIVSLTIGDGRLGSMETGVGLVRAIIKVMELCDAGLKIDVINMSYGEHAAWSNSGRIGELMAELVNRYGVVWVSSAGNHGPALGTIGTPPDIQADACVSVGAYFSPEMLEAEYSLREKLPGNLYTWTSRDPCIDGGSGVTCCSPGAAIASVPEYTLSNSQLMNGTSMSAPHVAGAIAIIISALKQLKINYTPYSIKRAIWNTSTHLSNVDQFAQGSGLLNVEKLFDYLKNYQNGPEINVRFAISVGTNGNKGIHMRNGKLTKTEEFNVNVEPLMFNEKFVDPSEKINFNIRLALVPTHPWIQCGRFIDLCYTARSFNIKIDPTNLQPGVYRGAVKAYDTSVGAEKGSIFEVPITVVQPFEVDVSRCEYVPSPTTLNCKPNTIIRDFVSIPNNATYGVLEMISADSKYNVGGKFLVHTMQIIDQRYCKFMETAKILPVNGECVTYHPFKCIGGKIVEICIAKYWSNFGEIPLQYKVKFHGFKSHEHQMHSANCIHRIDVTSLLSEECQPSISLKHSVMILKPTDTKISTLTKRDVIPNQRQIFQNVLTYSLHLTKSQELSLHAPLFSSILYESVFESQFWMLFDVNKMLIQSGDAYSNNTYFKLDKGDYVVKLQVRHEKKELLEKTNEVVMQAYFKLANSINLDIYKSFNTAILGNNKKISTFMMSSGGTKPIYVAPLANEKITKNIVGQSSWFEGTLTLAKDEYGKKVDTHTFMYLLTEGPIIKKNGSTLKESKTKMEEYKEGLRNYKCDFIVKLEADDAEALYKEVLAANPNFFGAHLSLIQNIENGSDMKTQLPNAFYKQIRDITTNLDELKTKLSKIVKLSNQVIEGISQDALLSYYGMKTDNRSDAMRIKQQMDKQKTQLLEAYVKKAVAVGKLNMIRNLEQETNNAENDEELDTLMIEMMKFVDFNDPKYLLLPIWHSFTSQQYGRSLKYLQKMYEDKLQRDVLDELSAICELKNWDHISLLIKRISVTANPQSYRMF